MWVINTIFAAIVVAVIFIGVIGVQGIERNVEACRAKGGIYVSGHTALCFKKDSVIPLN